ncbi:hypothetical protein QX201_006156 [Fusarium graminearum]
MSKQPAEKVESQKTDPRKSEYVACALLFGDAGPILACHEMLGIDKKISSRMALFKNKDCHPYFGVQLTIPRDQGQKVSEDKGFGVCHTYEQASHTSLPNDHMITIRFPRGKVACSYDPVPLSVRNKFPAIKEWEKFSYITVGLNDGAFPTIDGYAKPFANPVDRDLEGWVNDNKSMIEGVTMLDMLQQRVFFFVVRRPTAPASKSLGDEHVPPPFDYGYPAQPLEYDEMVAMVDGNPGADFLASYGFSTDHDHMTVVNQANIQDLLWVDREATQISEEIHAAYFVTPETGAAIGARSLYVVFPVTQQWRIAHDAAWRRLTKNELFQVKIYETITPKGSEYKPAAWYLMAYLQYSNNYI